MNANDAKRMGQSIVTALTLDRLRTEHRLDDGGIAVLDAAKRELEQYASRDLVVGFLNWQATGMMRRDPRPRAVVDTGLTAQTPAEEARAAARRASPARHAF